MAVILSKWVLKIQELATANSGVNENYTINKIMKNEACIHDNLKTIMNKIYLNKKHEEP